MLKYLGLPGLDVADKKNVSASTGTNTDTLRRLNLDWPLMWSSGGTIHDVPTDTIPDQCGFHNVKVEFPENFKVYVNSTDYFMSDLPPIDNLINLDGVTPKFDMTQEYHRAIGGAYVASYLCGVSLDHLRPQEGVYPILTSLMNFHVYFHTMRFTKDPDLLTKYVRKLGPAIKWIPRVDDTYSYTQT